MGDEALYPKKNVNVCMPAEGSRKQELLRSRNVLAGTWLPNGL
jgi:hypothetical protein